MLEQVWGPDPEDWQIEIGHGAYFVRRRSDGAWTLVWAQTLPSGAFSSEVLSQAEAAPSREEFMRQVARHVRAHVA